MYARHRTEFTSPQPGGYSDGTIATIEPQTLGAARQIAEQARAEEMKRLFTGLGRRLRDLALSRRRWGI